MIDLNYFKECIDECIPDSSGVVDVLKSSLEEITDRAIAAESEIELKENEINKLVLRTANSENELAKCLNERDELKAKIVEMEKQEPFGWFVDVEYCGFTKSKPSESYKSNSTTLYAQPKPSTPAQRITEQDAREILIMYFSVGGMLTKLNEGRSKSIENWIAGDGRTLLAKLNEHKGI